MASNTPMEDTIRQKVGYILVIYRKRVNDGVRQLTAALAPTTLEILNDSRKHSHHQAMEGVTSKETHFR